MNGVNWYSFNLYNTFDIADNMADPTIQTFCCRHTNKTDMAIKIMEDFNTDVYNIVCMLSSTMGILGAVYQVIWNINTVS